MLAARLVGRDAALHEDAFFALVDRFDVELSLGVTAELWWRSHSRSRKGCGCSFSEYIFFYETLRKAYSICARIVSARTTLVSSFASFSYLFLKGAYLHDTSAQNKQKKKQKEKKTWTFCFSWEGPGIQTQSKTIHEKIAQCVTIHRKCGNCTYLYMNWHSFARDILVPRVSAFWIDARRNLEEFFKKRKADRHELVIVTIALTFEGRHPRLWNYWILTQMFCFHCFLFLIWWTLSDGGGRRRDCTLPVFQSAWRSTVQPAAQLALSLYCSPSVSRYPRVSAVLRIVFVYLMLFWEFTQTVF